MTARPHALAVAAFAALLSGPILADDLPTQGFADTLEGAALVRELRQGGYVLYTRHATTEIDYADQVVADPAFCSTQRVLSEAGWHEAKAIGAHIRRLNVPIGTVYSSQFCRAWQTADLAYGRYEKRAELNFAKAEDYTEEQWARMGADVSRFLAAAPAAGTNTAVVAHDDPFEAATGLYPEPQGVTFIVKPDGKGGFDLIADLTPSEWGSMKP